MAFYIYRITNKINGKIYIGKTTNVEKRWKRHISDSKDKKRCFYFQNAIIKYGKDNFIIDVLENVDSEETAFELEKKWVKILKTNKKQFGYNLTEGGDGFFSSFFSEERREKISSIQKGKKLTEEHKKKISQSNIGKKLTEEQCLSISKSKIGENNGMFERTHSDETKQKMSEFQKNRVRRKLTEEEKNIISQKVKAVGKQPKISLETKNNVKQLYASGQFSKRQLSEKLGLKYNTVVKILRK